jgi:hypothetical protein
MDQLGPTERWILARATAPVAAGYRGYAEENIGEV